MENSPRIKASHFIETLAAPLKNSGYGDYLLRLLREPFQGG